MTCREVEPLLNPYVDAELDIASVLGVERHFGECAGCEARYRRLQELRREIAEADPDFRPAAGLARRIERARRRESGPRRWWGPAAWVAAAAVVIVLLVPFGRFGGNSAKDREVLDAHLRSLAESHLVDVPSTDQHTVKPWFQGRIGFSPNVPDLSREGFLLVGGRTEVLDGNRAAALVYRRGGHIINVFIAEASGRATAVQRSSSNGFNLLRWNTGEGLAYRVVSDLNSAELLHFASLVTPPAHR